LRSASDNPHFMQPGIAK